MGKPVRIGLLTLSFLPRRGGMEFVVRDLAEALQGAGHDVTVFAPRLRRGESEIPHTYDLVRFGLSVRGAYRIGINRWVLRRLFGRLHRKRKFDVLNVHSAHLATTYALSAVRGRAVPVVVTCHGHDIQRDASVGYGLRLDPKHDRRIRDNLLRADRIVAISESMYDDLVGLVPSERIVRIPNGIWLPEGEKGVRGTLFGGERGPIVLLVGRNHPKKGFETGLRAFRRVIEEHPTALLVHVGRGGETLEKLARELELGDRFRPVGERSREEVWSMYRRADIFLLPSAVESFGIVTVEAMSFSLPCVVTDGPGSRDIVRDRETGRVVPVNDVEAMARTLLDLVTDESERRVLGEAARKMVEERYAWPMVAKRYVDVFRSCGTGESKP